MQYSGTTIRGFAKTDSAKIRFEHILTHARQIGNSESCVQIQKYFNLFWQPRVLNLLSAIKLISFQIVSPRMNIIT